MPIEAFLVARDRSVKQPRPIRKYFGQHAPRLANCLDRIGVLFLLDNLHVLPFDWIFENGWPALLIGMARGCFGNGLGES